ncbi:E3 20.1 kDa protein [Human adenovirus 14]|nr:E3 20.1 kDa protein [Human adenovirus 14]
MPNMAEIRSDDNSLETFTSSTTPDEKNIPDSMIAIIAAVAVVMALTVICMLLYACRYKKFHPKKQDLLLRLNI